MINQSWCRNYRRQITGLLAALGMSGALLLTGCSGGSGSGGGSNSSAPTSQTGMAMVTLTDDPGDFLSYEVTVESLQLTRSDGTVVETVPNATQVDFAQLVNISEIISAEQIPSGSYTAVTLTLNYVATSTTPAANIVVDNGTMSGVTVPGGQIVKFGSAPPDGTQVKTLAMTLQLPSGSPLVITPGTIANLALDFNLTATNMAVNYPGLTPVTSWSSANSSNLAVEVSPVLQASLTPDTTKQIRVRGPLASVNPTNDSYTIDVRSFFDNSGSQGTFTVNVTTTGSTPTTFLINGTSYTGSAGLTALGALVSTTPPTLTVAYGSFDISTHTFTASEVLAGSSVAGGNLDSVEGTVIARTNTPMSGTGAATLMVSRGRIFRAGQGGFAPSFGRTITVDIDNSTTVTEDGRTGPFTIANISVGQHLQVFGKYSNSSGTPTLDATVAGGNAQLAFTGLWGLFESSTSVSAGNVVTLNLQSLDGLPPSAFNFAGTGISGEDATASSYTVEVPAALTVPMWSAGAPAAFAGFVSPFGTADGTIVPDFGAGTLGNYTNTDAILLVGWMPPGTADPFTMFTMTSTDLVMSESTLAGANFYRFNLGPESIAASSLTSDLTLSADTSTTAMTQFGIVHVMSHTIDTYSSFSGSPSSLVATLYGDLNPSSGTAPSVLGVFAVGPYDGASSDLSVDRLFVALSD
jgi:Domain of unknown function (DUF4382)